ncbi:hypothetical protein ACFQ08_37745 [Streptosporangium algeriense]|uniref:Alkaline shock response membrane anchor protein AmaP n=1 Tax=Streptosporangium algeriense TaxID=1682748 RepID=A0ABW3E537_9ACTN
MRVYLDNRIGLALTGAVLTGAGSYACLRGRGGLSSQPRDDRIMGRGLPAYLEQHAWLGWLAALLLVVLALLSIRWLLRALGWGRVGRSSATGTAMLGVAVKEIEGLVRVRVRHSKGDRLRVAITCGPATDVGRLVARLNKDAVAKVRRTIGEEDLGAWVRLHVRSR